MNKEFDLYLEIAGFRPRTKPKINRFGRSTRNLRENGFQCAHCRGYVCSEPSLSGVQNRNHCPYCLWSRHLDLYEAGDRLAVCKAAMQPIALTLKKTRKKYGVAKYGELMLIHQCSECGKLSINRIAADDHPGTVFELFEDSIGLDKLTKTLFDQDGIRPLDAADEFVVRAQLFGWQTSSIEPQKAMSVG